MSSAPLPLTEAERLAALRSYDVLDSTFEAAFDNIAELAAHLTGSPIAFVSLTDAERQWFKARYGLTVAEVPREHAFCAWAILEPDHPLIVPDMRADPRFADNPLVTAGPEIRFYAGAPLVNREGLALGTLCVMDRKPREFDESKQIVLKRLAETMMTTLELRRAMAEVKRMALTDGLTGLPNRSAFLSDVARAVARQRQEGVPFTMLYFDLDGFKAVNDRRGHATGDEVLQHVANTLTDLLAEEDLAARLGGDEFAVLLPGGPERLGLAETMRVSLAGRMAANGWQVTASIGAATFHAPPGSVDEAITATDALMYGAKAAGGNRVLHRDYGLAEAAGPVLQRESTDSCTQPKGALSPT